MSEPIVYVVDDDESVRDALALLLASVDLNAKTFESAASVLQAMEDDGVVPECMVLDIRMPGMSGMELQKQLTSQNIELPIVFLTGHGDVPMAVEAMKRGAVDFLRKPFRDQELLDCIYAALENAKQDQESRADRLEAQERVDSLTGREREVFDLVCEGRSNKVIAIDLGISERTVEIHRSQVMRKTGVRSLAELVRLSVLLETNV